MSKKKDVSQSRVLLPKRNFGAEQFKYNCYSLIMPVEHDKSMLKEFEYFGFVTRGIQVGDKFHIRKQDMSYYAEGIVLKVTDNVGIKLFITVEHDLVSKLNVDAAPLVEQKDSKGYSITWGGPVVKWRVLYDNKVLLDKLASKEDAQKELDKHLEQIA